MSDPKHLSESMAVTLAGLRERHPDVDEDIPSAADEVKAQREQGLRERWDSQIPIRFRYADLGDLDDETAQAMTEWAGRLTNLMLVGPVGVGKTHAAVAAVRGPHFAGACATFCPVVELLDQMRPGGEDDVLEHLLGVPILVLDDLGAERPTDWTMERLYALVNRRWLDMLPTVVTTNVPPDQIESAIGERLLSRLSHDALVYRLAGADRRR